MAEDTGIVITILSSLFCVMCGGLGFYTKITNKRIDGVIFEIDRLFREDHVHRNEFIREIDRIDNIREEQVKNTVRIDTLCTAVHNLNDDIHGLEMRINTHFNSCRPHETGDE